MTDILSKLSGEQFLGLCGIGLGLVAILGGISVAITQVISTSSRRKMLDEMEATLKLEMIQRGLSAGEIKQILEARSASSKGFSIDLSGLGSVTMPTAPIFGKKCEKT
jgi:hypothetical protein